MIIGLIVGPLVGLLGSHLLLHELKWDWRIVAAISTLFLLLVLAAGFTSLELRLGFVVGALLGLLLNVTGSQISQEAGGNSE